MTITSQQVDAWDAEVDAAYAAGRQEGMKQERALWELSRLGQEIEAQPEEQQSCDKQEPVAWLVTGPYELVAFSNLNSAKAFCRGLNKGFGEEAYSIKMLYTAPPERRWVGLTDAERDECDWGQGERDFARIIEAKLKEKNT